MVVELRAEPENVFYSRLTIRIPAKPGPRNSEFVCIGTRDGTFRLML